MPPYASTADNLRLRPSLLLIKEQSVIVVTTEIDPEDFRQPRWVTHRFAGTEPFNALAAYRKSTITPTPPLLAPPTKWLKYGCVTRDAVSGYVNCRRKMVVIAPLVPSHARDYCRTSIPPDAAAQSWTSHVKNEK